jgi:hypothetical protein
LLFGIKCPGQGIYGKTIAGIKEGKRDSNYVFKDRLPKFVSPIVPIPLKQPVVAPTKSQAKDTMLWYVGRRLNDSILVTPERSVILYSRNRNLVVIQPDQRKDSATINLVRSLSEWKQLNVKHIETFAAQKNAFFDYPEIENDIAELDRLEQQYTDIVRNTIAIPSQADLMVFSGSSYENLTGGPFQQDDDALLALYMRLKNLMDSEPNLDVAQPPLACENCASDIPEIEVNDAWQRQFLEYETNLLTIAKTIQGYMALNNISTAQSGIPSLQQLLVAAFNKAFDRWDRKVEILESICKREPALMSTIIVNLLLLQNQKKI